MVKLTVNGVEREFDGDPQIPLLWYVRDILGRVGSRMPVRAYVERDGRVRISDFYVQ